MLCAEMTSCFIPKITYHKGNMLSLSLLKRTAIDLVDVRIVGSSVKTYLCRAVAINAPN